MCGLPWKTSSCIRIRKKKEHIFPELWRLSLGAFAEFGMQLYASSYLSEWNTSAPTGRICIASDT